MEPLQSAGPGSPGQGPPEGGGGIAAFLKDWALAAGVAAAVLVGVGLLQRRASGPVDPGAPFELPTPDGDTLRLADHRGSTVVLNFWASWCGPCRAEIPDFARFHKDYPEVVMIGVAVDSGGPAEVGAAAKKMGITWPVALADAGVVGAYGVQVLPQTVVLGPDLQARHSHVGKMSYADLAAAVR